MKESDIIFPSIVETFLKQGMNSIDEQEAADIHQFLEMVYAEQPCNEKAVYGLIKIYNAKKEFEQAKEIGQSFIMMDGYNKDILGELSITFLSLNQMDTYFSLVKQHLEKEAQLEDVPNDDFSEESNVIPFPKKIKPRRNIQNFLEWGTAEQLEFLQQARFHDIDSYLEAFQIFLKDAETSPYVKSMVFELLQEKNVDTVFRVKKLGLEGDFNPSKVSVLTDDPFTKELTGALTKRWEHDNPSFLEQLLVIVQLHLFIMYPFQMPSKDVALWSEAYSSWLSQLYGEEPSENVAINPDELLEAKRFIEKMEKVQQNYLL
ncbi:hypothetical protein UE46_07920 [Listeria weihenstephanensis]|uniref:TPR repeat-containing protein n=1 Tax=Listeria weihenstephanensis TaxID=1006155 RepID=A0A1S7FU45_9LIST|nr:tetratricopeptide repeat protein [Listeria weihenstephanensis]AQY50976.1 hypothetical protein UE46_07920 [Listeria weihenstephanensis]